MFNVSGVVATTLAVTVFNATAGRSSFNASRKEVDKIAELITFFGQLCYPPPLLLLCLIGNTMSFVVVGRVCPGSSTSVYFRCLAVADTLTAYTYLGRVWLHAAFSILINTLSDASCILITFINYTSGDFAIWLLVAVSCDRLVAVFRPFLARQWCSARYARLVACGILLCTSAKNGSIFFSYRVLRLPKEIGPKCTYLRGHALTYFEHQVRRTLTLTVSGLIPVTVIMVLNMLVVYQLVKHRRNMRRRWETQERESKLLRPESSDANGVSQPSSVERRSDTRKSGEAAAIRIALANSIMSCCLVLPQFVVNVFKQFQYGEVLRAVQVFTTFLLYCNHSANFYVSFTASREYRRKAKATLGCGPPPVERTFTAISTFKHSPKASSAD